VWDLRRQKVPSGKQPIFIRMREGQSFVFAGLWDRWNGMESFTIITTRPNELCSKVHDRMPAILKEQDFTKWINPTSLVEEITTLIQAYAADEMECFPVSRLVNSPRSDSAACVQPLDLGSSTTLAISPAQELKQQSLI
jgi:putative SOS response-associated peptidase YedK